MSETLLAPEVVQLVDEILARKQVEDEARRSRPSPKTPGRTGGVQLVAERTNGKAAKAIEPASVPAPEAPAPGPGFPWDQPRQQIVQLVRDMEDAADLIKRTINQYQQAIAVLEAASEDLRSGAAQIAKHLQPEVTTDEPKAESPKPADPGHWVCPTHREAERRVSRKGRTYWACPKCWDFERP